MSNIIYKYMSEYCNELVGKWCRELEVLTQFAKSQPQAAYAAYIKGYKSKFTYFLRTIEDFGQFLEPIEELLRNKFIPILFDIPGTVPSELRNLFALPVKEGGMGISCLKTEAIDQYLASTSITQVHVGSIIGQSRVLAEKKWRWK